MDPVVGISIGDPGGIGVEVTLKALSRLRNLPDARFIVLGPPAFIHSEKNRLHLDLSFSEYDQRSTSPLPRHSLLAVSPGFKLQHRSRSYPDNGRLSFSCFEAGVQLAEAGTIQALVTAPISKESWKMAGLSHPGHTAYFNRKYPRAIMSFFSPRLNVALFTHHLPLQDAIKKVRRQALTAFLLELEKSIDKIGDYRFVLAGLNPHAGEHGMLGREEIEEIIPAMEAAQKAGMDISGPSPPDTVCRQALDKPDIIVISLYHDQGLAAFKLVAFESGVNVTLGLPFIRTSPDHGTAFDIAGSGQADPESMEQALRLAVEFASRGT